MLSLKRTHGLGNILLLLPVLLKYVEQGNRVSLYTRPEWRDTFHELMPEIEWPDMLPMDALDLDVLTETIRPIEHRTHEFGRLLDIPPPYPILEIIPPASWALPFREFASAFIVAPEAGHPARQWPYECIRTVCRKLLNDGRKVVLVGSHPAEPLPCSSDLTGRTTLKDLFGLLHLATGILCMDSGVLHIAKALRTPTTAVFAGVNPHFRILPTDKVVAVQARKPCCPCNKNEVCQGRYDCLHRIAPQAVLPSCQDSHAIDTFILKQI